MLNQKGQVLGVSVSIVGFILLLGIVMTFGWINVAPTDVAVEINKVAGAVNPVPKAVGYHFFNRWITDMVTYKVAARAYPPDTAANENSDKYNLDLKTNDGQNIEVDLTIIYSLVSKEVPNLHQQIGKHYEDQILLPQIRSEARLVVGSYAAEAIYQGKVRDDIQQEIKRKLALALEKYPAIQIQDALLRHFAFSKAFENKIEEKKLKAQQVEINKNSALAEEEEAKRKEAQARGEKLKVLQEAEGRAESAKIEADANRYKLEQEAAGQLAKYKADAEGKKLQADALGGGHNVVALRFADKLSPALQVIGVPVGTTSTSIMDLNGVTKGLFNKVSQ